MMLHSPEVPAQKHSRAEVTSLRRRIQRRAFDALYRWGAVGYDLVAWGAFGDDWAAWRTAAANLVDDTPVLDLGCGTGALVAELGRRGVPAVGVDRSAAMLDVARRRAAGAALGLVRADARELPFSGRGFGGVISTFPAPFILDDDVAREVARVLRPAGVIVVMVGGRIDRWRWWQAPRRLLLRLFYGRATTGGATGPAQSALLGDGFSGNWLEVSGPQGRGWVWVGRPD